MSALGQKQTFAAHKRMSALPPKADMCGAKRDVRSGPKADILRCGKNSLVDHLVASGGIFVAQLSLKYLAGFFARQHFSKFNHAWNLEIR